MGVEMISLEKFEKKTRISSSTFLKWIKTNKIPKNLYVIHFKLHNNYYLINGNECLKFVKDNIHQFKKRAESRWNLDGRISA